MKAALLQIAVLSSLTILTACGGGKSSSSNGSTSKPAAASYAQKNKDRCVTDQKMINALLSPEHKKDIIISDGCLENTSTKDSIIFLTEVNLNMRVDFDESQIQNEFDQMIEEYYKYYLIKGISIEELKNITKINVEYFDYNGKQLTFKSASNQPSFDIELIKPIPGEYNRIASRVSIDAEHEGRVLLDEVKNGSLFSIIVK